jgi:diguanylate cyclase (GGDEF)-like protein
MSILEKLEKQSNILKVLYVYFFLFVILALDIETNYTIVFSLFCIIPIFFSAWCIDVGHGILIAFASSLVWLNADLISGHFYIHPYIFTINTIIKITFFVTISLLFSTLKSKLLREKDLAQTDFLTGAKNSRYFYESLDQEVYRSQRTKNAFTLIYIDLDNFKKVNDQFGHSIGDNVLRKVVSITSKNLRKTDVMARLGGDEFAVLLPETNKEAASTIISKLQTILNDEMQKSNWPITFSIGVLICNSTNTNTIELIKFADNLMYSVKNNGKNGINYAYYTKSNPLLNSTVAIN